MAGDGSGGPPPTLPNPRHADLVAALGRATALKHAVDGRLTGVTNAMRGHAWTGGTSDQFFAELSTNTAQIRGATTGCVDNVQSALNHCPTTVPNPAAEKT